MTVYVVDWLSLLVRWLHIVTGIAWIGASFYFVWLDNHLRPSGKASDDERGVAGEVWSVHGGGFYRNEKFLLGPRGEPLTDRLHWFKWEAYWTWLSGMLLLGLVYWYGAAVYLVDPRVADLPVASAIAISAAFPVVGWLAYDALCRLVRNDMLLAALVAALLIVIDWSLFRLFSARAAYLHVGAVIGTIMVANVFFVIIPGQKKTVAAIRAGTPPDPVHGLRGKQRSVHNTYLTLPVLLIMISTHYPMTYQHPLGWLVLVGLSAAGVLVRRYFVLRHSGRAALVLPATAVAIVVLVAAAIVPRPDTGAHDAVSIEPGTVAGIVRERCAGCHAAHPANPAFPVAPAGVAFDTQAEIDAMAVRIYQRAVVTRDMPPGNLTQMTDAERARIAAWHAQREQR